MFVGVLTNAIFGMLLLLLATATRAPWPRLDDVVFAGMNASLMLFVISLLAESTWLMRIATPVLGLCILAGLAARTVALLGRAAGHDTSTIAPATT